MGIAFRCIDRNLIVKFIGELDHYNCEKIKGEVDDLISEHNIKNLIFDFQNIDFMDSSGIGIIMGRYNRVKDFGGEVAIVNIKDKLNNILEMSGLYNVASKYETIDNALKNID